MLLRWLIHPFRKPSHCGNAYITDHPTTLFGEKLKDQVEERLKFYETGEAPQKNTVVMEEAMSELKKLQEKVAPSSEKKKKKKGRKEKMEE